MFRALEMVKDVALAAAASGNVAYARRAELSGGYASDGVGGAGRQQVHPKLRGGRTIQLGEFDAQQNLLLHPGGGQLQIVDNGLRKRRRERRGPLRGLLVGNMPG